MPIFLMGYSMVCFLWAARCERTSLASHSTFRAEEKFLDFAPREWKAHHPSTHSLVLFPPTLRKFQIWIADILSALFPAILIYVGAKVYCRAFSCLTRYANSCCCMILKPTMPTSMTLWTTHQVLLNDSSTWWPMYILTTFSWKGICNQVVFIIDLERENNYINWPKSLPVRLLNKCIM